MDAKVTPDIGGPRRHRGHYATAVTFGAAVVGVALVVLLASLAWLSGCRSGSEVVSLAGCDVVRRYTLAIGPALVLFLGGVAAFVRTYQLWRTRGPWLVWQGAGWFLLMLMLVVLFMTAPPALLL